MDDKILPERPHTDKAVRHLGYWIRHWREKCGLSQREVARSSGVGKSTIHYLEKGIFRTISVEHLERIVRAFGISLNDFFSWKENFDKERIYRGLSEKPIFYFAPPVEGCLILSLTPRKEEFFFGKITLKPRVSVGKTNSPQARWVLYVVNSGILHLEIETVHYVLRQGEYVIFDGRQSYELHNPDAFRDSTCFLFTVPSFVFASEEVYDIPRLPKDIS